MHLWLQAVASSIVVSLASLVCLALLPLLSGPSLGVQGVSERFTAALMAFAAGAMLGETCLHQMPEAFQGAGLHLDDNEHHQHSHQGQTAGLLVFSGIFLFFLIESSVHRLSTSHHGHAHTLAQAASLHPGSPLQPAQAQPAHSQHEASAQSETARRRQRSLHGSSPDQVACLGAPCNDGRLHAVDASKRDRRGWPQWLWLPAGTHPMAYLNLLADGVHNFTDGIALSSAFLSGGHIAGWRRTLVILMHELPQEIGDFGILVSSGLTPQQALGWNLVSAGTAVVGAALVPLVAVLLPGWSGLGGAGQGWLASLEALTAGGFLWIAIGDVLPQLASRPHMLQSSGFVVAGLAGCLVFEVLAH